MCKCCGTLYAPLSLFLNDDNYGNGWGGWGGYGGCGCGGSGTLFFFIIGISTLSGLGLFLDWFG